MHPITATTTHAAVPDRTACRGPRGVADGEGSGPRRLHRRGQPRLRERHRPDERRRAVAHAWVDAEFKARLLDDGSSALAELGIGGPEDHIVAVANEPGVHNVVVCTLCSCYPWSILGLPPGWYKEAPYRARMVREPRALLREMGCDCPTTSTSGSGTARPRCATSSYRRGQPGRTI